MISTKTAAPPRPTFGWLVPSLSDLLFLALVLWLLLFTLGGSANGLLHDAAAGFHIRTGDWILAHQSVPYQDPFSFSKPNAPWFAWEWLADILFSLIHSALGLKGIILFACFALAGTMWISLRHMSSKGGHALATLFVMHALIGAGSVHFLARPHVFTLLFLAIAFWMIEEDRERPTRWLFALVPLSALWANLHGGFAGLVITLAALAAGHVLEADWTRAKRYGFTAIACLAAAVVNPYGFQLLVHMQQYLRAGWIREMVEEFQAPKLETPAGMYFEALLFAGIAVAAKLAWERRFAPALLIIAWGHAALLSVRHVPIFALLIAPFLAREITLLMRQAQERFGRKSIWGILNQIGDEHTPNLTRSSFLIPALVVALLVSDLGFQWPTDFPSGKFPLAAIERHGELIRTQRVFTLDSWGDYLTYRHYPGQKVFFDGRTDYYGEKMSRDYKALIDGHPGWQERLARYKVDAVFLPQDSPLVGHLRADPAWESLATVQEVAMLRRRP
jgi:hypothetical protein